MTARLVVCLRYGAVECEPAHYLTVARRAEAALAAVGGERVSWGADRYSFELDPADFSLVLRQLIATELECPEHGIGVALGELVGAGEGAVWGRALVVASALAGAAKPGEILLDPKLEDVRRDRLATLGRIPVRVGEHYVGAALILPGACPATGYRELAVGETLPPAAGVAHSVPPSPLPPRAPASLPPRPSVFDALRSGDPDVMSGLASSLRSENPEHVAAPRLEAMALLARGRVDEGLTQLEDSAERSFVGPPLVRAQALLALAVGYARVGESRRAALTTLRALGESRRARDPRAEQACAQLLAQLAAAAGAAEVARAWQRTSQAVA